MDRIELQQWTTTDRATLETKVLRVNEFLTPSLTVMLLHPKLPARSFVYPAHNDIMDVDPSDVLEPYNRHW